MVQEVQQELINTYIGCFQPPFAGSLETFAQQENIKITTGPIGGPVSFNETPYLRAPAEALLNPNIRQVNIIAAVQTGKSFLGELYLLYLAMYDPCPVLSFHLEEAHCREFCSRAADLFQLTPRIAEMLKLKNNSILVDEIELANKMRVLFLSPYSDAALHGRTAKVVRLDDPHEFPVGSIEKAISRTNMYASTRKLLISSQPNQAGSELDKHYKVGQLYQWQWLCPQCKQYQAFHWSKEREDGTFGGFNCDEILNVDGTRNIDLSATTTWLECFHCKHQVVDNKANRRYLNDTGKHVCIKSDGDQTVVTYTWPGFVNRGLSFSYFMEKFLSAKKEEKRTGLKTNLITFKNQVLGEFYHREKDIDITSIPMGDYVSTEHWEEEHIKVLSVDCQQIGEVKYCGVRAWNKACTESRLLEVNVTREWKDIKGLQNKWKIPPFCVAIDSGDGPVTPQIYSECITNGESMLDKYGRQIDWLTWTALKGADDDTFTHDGEIKKLYSKPFKGDPLFSENSKFKGIFAMGYRWSNPSIKTILLKLRDSQISGFKWLTNRRDLEYERQLWSEGPVEETDKKTGLTKIRFHQHANANHWLDVEAQSLVMAIMLGYFSVEGK